MFSEIYEYFLSRAPKPIKKMGYVYSSIALERRGRRQKKAWKPHIDKCHEFWAEILKDQHFDCIAVLGSGPLLELPMSIVLEHCDELHLVDVVHPRAVLRKWEAQPKIRFHAVDITGFVAWANSTGVGDLKQLDFQVPNLDFKPDLLVSANILSQLSLEPTWWLRRKLGLEDEDSFIQNLIKKIHRDHIEFLEDLPRKASYLYSDITRDYVGGDGEVLESHSSRVFPEEFQNSALKAWKWTLCPLGEESKDYEIQMRISVYRVL